MSDLLKPKDRPEAVALFRAQVIGPLLCRDFGSHGQLAEAIRAIATEPVRPPGYTTSRTYGASTIERWYYAFRKEGLGGLRPRGNERGFALGLDDAQRELLRAIRKDHPQVSAALILRTLVTEGKLRAGAISAPTLRRFYAAEGLDRQTLKLSDREPRRRWEAHAPNVLWHTDVCHGPALRIDGRAVPLRIHALLDDHSRYVVALQACSTERESEMLALTAKAFRRHGLPDCVYADNGPTYVGETLATFCGRLGVGLLHAKPYDPQARGKMERFWRTLQEQCLDHCGGLGSLHDVQVRLLAWLDKHYHATAHSSLLGKTPAEVYETGARKPAPDAMLEEALIVRARRRVRRDGTVPIAGTDFELDQGYLSGRVITVARSLLDPTTLPWVEHEDQRLELRPVDAQKNAQRPAQKGAPRRSAKGVDAVPFNPPGALLRAATGQQGGES